ncbi:MAG: BatA domain-containing protein, partial [Thermoguttaceae bacterium]|nr:BatA domain-containing protein [Thermoguttaceae bacterium]
MQTPWALFALATLALPWLFLRRRRPTAPPPRVSFPTVRLLAPSLRRAVKRKERRLLVLATIRSFALLSLVLI